MSDPVSSPVQGEAVEPVADTEAAETTERELRETDGAALITAERRRQVEVEGYSRDHDMHHPVRHFVFAAGAYLGLCAWPWDRKYFKPVSTAYAESHYVERNLVKAGALIAAAIDRLRASS